MDKTNKSVGGYIFAVLAYLCWGLSPLFWNLLAWLSAFQILVFRISCSLGLIWLFILLRGKRVSLKKLYTTWPAIFASGILLAINWGVFVFAVNNGFLQDASLGYYINPLVSIFLGMLFFKEKLHPVEWLALGLALLGVGFLAIKLHSFPWISLILAFSFGFYGLLKKRSSFAALEGLSLELIFIFPFLVGFLIFFSGGETSFSLPSRELSRGQWVLILATAPVTIIPLVLFGKAVGKINLSSAGFLQFITPTISLLLSITVFAEPFLPGKLPGFILVWIALVMYVAVRLHKAHKETG